MTSSYGAFAVSVRDQISAAVAATAGAAKQLAARYKGDKAGALLGFDRSLPGATVVVGKLQEKYGGWAFRVNVFHPKLESCVRTVGVDRQRAPTES